MKTWEMYKCLTDDKNKQFKRMFDGELYGLDEDGMLSILSKVEAYRCASVNEEWEEFQCGIIIEVKFNDELPSKYDYKHFDVMLDNGDIETFHYHIHNPMPYKEEMIGLTWNELCDLCRKMWYEAIKN